MCGEGVRPRSSAHLTEGAPLEHLVTAAERPCPTIDRQGRERSQLQVQAVKARAGELPVGVRRLMAADDGPTVRVAAFQSSL